jgi:hypothetical protein
VIDTYVRAAQDQVEQQLAADPQYRQAQDQTSLQRPRLDDARAFGGREAIRLAEADLNLALDRERRMRDAAYAGSVPYQRAKGLAAELAPPAPDETAQRIADAIADHRLVAGMTLDEAMRAMGADPVLLDSSGPITHYRWKIVGRVGDTVEIHGD